MQSILQPCLILFGHSDPRHSSCVPRQSCFHTSSIPYRGTQELCPRPRFQTDSGMSMARLCSHSLNELAFGVTHTWIWACALSVKTTLMLFSKGQHTLVPSDTVHHLMSVKWCVSTNTGSGTSAWNSVSHSSPRGDDNVPTLVANCQKKKASTKLPGCAAYCYWLLFEKQNDVDSLYIQILLQKQQRNPEFTSLTKQLFSQEKKKTCAGNRTLAWSAVAQPGVSPAADVC